MASYDTAHSFEHISSVRSEKLEQIGLERNEKSNGQHNGALLSPNGQEKWTEKVIISTVSRRTKISEFHVDLSHTSLLLPRSLHRY